MRNLGKVVMKALAVLMMFPALTSNAPPRQLPTFEIAHQGKQLISAKEVSGTYLRMVSPEFRIAT
jgi:hypothetical protein